MKNIPYQSIQKKNEELDHIVYLSYLYDFYGILLKDHHREIFEDYVLNDMSLGEIARERNITRQGIFDIVKRCIKRLEDYEQKLCLIKKFRLTKEKLNEIEKIAKNDNNESSKRIVTLTHEIYHMI